MAKKSRNVNILQVLLIAIALSSPFLTFPSVLAESYYNKDFEWSYKGYTWTWSLSIPQSLYTTYKRVSISQRTQYSGYSFLVTTRDTYVKQVANKLHEAATQKGYGAFDEVSFILAFVQSLPYTSDAVTTGHDEYPRFPIETLVDDGGDCEDTSILFATLMLLLDYAAIFINPTGHIAVGVWGTDLNGYYYTYSNRRYYYCETTGDNFKIGDMPSEYEGASAHLYSINEGSQYIPNQPTTPNPTTPDPDQGTTSAPNPAAGLLTVIAIAVGLIGGMIYLSGRATRKQMRSDVASPPSPPPPPQPLASPQVVPLTQTAETKFCRYCGERNKTDSIFCEKCGRKIS